MAAAPAQAAVIVGAQTVQPTGDSNAAGVAEAFRTTATTSGAVGTLGVYVDTGTPATRLAAGIYADASGRPGALLGQGSLTSPTAGAWNSVPLSTPATVTSGATYWIAILSPTGTGTLRFRDRCCSGGTAAETSSQTNLATLPATWSRGTVYNDGPASLFGATLDGPALAVAPATLNVSGVAGGADPAPATLAITNSGGGTLDWSVSDDAPWLSVSPASGSGAANLQVSTSLSGLAVGTYTGTITVTAPGAAGSPRTVAVTLTVAAAADTTPPTVSLTAPAAGASVSGTVAVSANAADAVGVTGVQFRLDGAVLGAEDTTAPYSVSWNTTGVANGAHSLTAVARDAAGNSTTSAAVGVTVANGSDPATVGSWSPVQDWPITAVHMVLMPTGQVLAFDGWADSPNSHRLWNPATGTFIAVPYNANIFCGGQTTLGDGRAIIIGGHVAAYVGTKDTTIFDATTSVWSKKADMFRSRWYPTATALPDGRVLAISGDNPTQGKPIGRLYDTSATIPEIYNPTTDTWTQLTGAARDVRLYPFMFVLPDGRVIDAGPFTQSQFLNLLTGTWTPGPTSQIDGHTAVQYRPGKIMKSGTAADPDFPDLTVTARTVVLDTNQLTPAWREVAPMAYPRSYHGLTMLPDGTVLAAGGSTHSDGVYQQWATKAAEIWNPDTETWSTMASEDRARLYHSTQLLLPDGRVLMAGGGAFPGSPAINESNAEVFSPPYLFKGPRPTIAASPATATYGSSFAVDTPDAASIRSVSLIRLGAATHSIDQGQEFVPLTFTAGQSQLLVQAPANANIATPGVYMLFIVDDKGVPSVASFLRMPVGADTTPPTVSLTAPAAGASVSGTVAVSANAADAVGVTGVQFRLDGAVLGAEDTTAPYSVSWNTTGVANGAHSLTAVARDAAGNSTTSAAVGVTVANAAAPALAVAPATLNVSGVAGGADPAPATLAITNSGGGTLDWSVSDDAPWLSVSPASGSGAANLQVSTSLSGLAVGTYTGTITVTAPGAAGSPRTVAVTLTVAAAADTTPPTVSLTAPAAGASVSGTVAVSANAADAVGVTGVQFRLDGAVLGAEDTTAPYSVSWNTTGVANGAHSLTAVARDAAGNSTTSAAVGVTVANAAPSGGLVAAYGFEETTGTAVTDSSGSGNAGTIAGGATRTTAGRFGRAISFDGVNDMVTVADSNSLDLTGAMTLEGWVNPAALGTTWRTLVLKESPGYFRYALYANTDTGGPSGHVFIGSDLDARAPTRLALNTWTHLATTYDGTTVRTYVNGTLVASRAVTGAMAASTNPLRIGGNSVWSEWFRGTIDEVRVYNRALSAAELTTDMNRGVAG